MANIQYTYKSPLHIIDTYDNVIDTYFWIHDAMNTLFESHENIKIRPTIAFSDGDMSYECHSIDEFKKYAFGKNIEVKWLSIGTSKFRAKGNLL